MELSNIDFRDVQGLLRFGHGHLPEACFLLVRIADAATARAWIAAHLPPLQKVETKNAEAPEPATVTTAEKGALSECALQVAFTYEGLRHLGASEDLLDGFSLEFTAGMTEPSRARRLGDVAANDPAKWHWGHRERLPHLVVLLYAKKGALGALESEIKDDLWGAAFAELPSLDTKDIGDIEPFGFTDGNSQPAIDWERQKSTRLRQTREYTNVAAVGEFVLGYSNEYGKYSDRPLLDPAADPRGILPLAEDLPNKRDFGRNGSYLVMRDLAQDVPAFWQFVDKQAKHDAAARWRLARAMVGRMVPNETNQHRYPDQNALPVNADIPSHDDIRIDGSPIVPLSDTGLKGVGPDLHEVWQNQFTYQKDPGGTACPFGAHIRRANPRNADLPEGVRGPISWLIRILGFGSRGHRDDLIASTRFHRILRRGREYGERLKVADALKGDSNENERGLRFICLNGNISRQFEFIQAAWLTNTKFDGLDEADPLLGNRVRLASANETDTFTQAQPTGVPCRSAGLPQFVTVRGGAYFFLPGISALRYLSQLGPR